MENKITSDDLRGMLDDYSPEQQMEMDAQTIREGAKALSDATSQLKECMNVLPELILSMREATTLHISENSVATIQKTGKEVGKNAAVAFNESVQQTIADARKSTKHVTLPAFAALNLLFLFIALLFFSGMIVYFDCILWHNDIIEKAMLASGTFFLGAVAFVAFMRYMEWI